MRHRFGLTDRALGRCASLVAGMCALALTGCGAGGSDPVENVDREVVIGSRQDPVSTLGDIFQADREREQSGEALRVNKYLWRASLDTLSFLPLSSTDPFSGVIATDWSASADAPDERYKVTVYITDPALAATALRVAVFREVRDGGAWTPAEVSPATPRRLEDAILTRARQIRVAELAAEQG